MCVLKILFLTMETKKKQSKILQTYLEKHILDSELCIFHNNECLWEYSRNGWNFVYINLGASENYVEINPILMQLNTQNLNH